MADTDVTAEAIVADAEAAAETLQQVKAEIARQLKQKIWPLYSGETP